MYYYLIIIVSLFSVFASGCTSDKDFISGLPELKSFQPERYMGVWYEIARFPHRFENGIIKASATYSLRPDGTVDVLNTGYRISDPTKRTDAKAVAHIVEGGPIGYLRVSFFRPFYGDYRIIALDETDYQYALVTSGTRDYLWILSRTKKMDAVVYDKLLKTARDAGLDTGKIYIVPQD
jgi:apolipoprotein D and lipocalin family protein